MGRHCCYRGPVAVPRAPTVLLRGLLRRCPRCGHGKLFTGWFRIVERCPRCDLPTERGEGYWLGAMAINLAVAEIAGGAVLVGGMLLTWPDVPWVTLTVIGLAAVVVVPIAFYPLSKTIFLAFDVLLHRMDPHRGQRHEPDAARRSRTP